MIMTHQFIEQFSVFGYHLHFLQVGFTLHVVHRGDVGYRVVQLHFIFVVVVIVRVTVELVADIFDVGWLEFEVESDFLIGDVI